MPALPTDKPCRYLTRNDYPKVGDLFDMGGYWKNNWTNPSQLKESMRGRAHADGSEREGYFHGFYSEELSRGFYARYLENDDINPLIIDAEKEMATITQALSALKLIIEQFDATLDSLKVSSHYGTT